jgi:hypothetical protein
MSPRPSAWVTTTRPIKQAATDDGTTRTARSHEVRTKGRDLVNAHAKGAVSPGAPDRALVDAHHQNYSSMSRNAGEVDLWHELTQLSTYKLLVDLLDIHRAPRALRPLLHRRYQSTLALLSERDREVAA